jgi:hypothetical protein
MTRIPDAISVASLDTHRLIVAVRNDGTTDITSNLAPRDAAHVLRQIASGYEQRAGSCGRALATGQPCPVHDAPTAPPAADAETAPRPLSEAMQAAGRMAAEGFARGIAQAQQTRTTTATTATAALYEALRRIADAPRDYELDPGRGDARAIIRTLLAEVEAQQPQADRAAAEQAAAEFDAGTPVLAGEQVTAYAAAIEATTLREAAERIMALGKARGWSTWAADYLHPDREFVDTADDDPRPRIEVDLDTPADPEPIEEQPAGTPERVRCAHDYWLMQDSCPGCDAEQETPHAADPVTLRPAWARRDMRRCRRCGLVPSHAIHRAKRTT